jgi:phosphatidylglycerophosphate synthase
MPSSSPQTPTELRAILIRREKTGEPGLKIWGIEAIERQKRCAKRLGATRCDLLNPGDFPPVDPENARYVVLRTDLVYDERLLEGLIDAGNVVLTDKLPGKQAGEAMAAHVEPHNLGAAVAAVRSLDYQVSGANSPEPFSDSKTPEEASSQVFRFAEILDLAPAFNQKLRKLLPPFVFQVEMGNIRKIENAIFKASYKGVTDLVTKWVWPLPARALTRVLAARGVRPNSVTAFSYVLTALATWFFIEGWFVQGLAAGWLMTFLDTVDGKLARCTLTSSKLGDVLDHGLDLVHPPFWWAAWAWGLSANFEGLEVATSIVVGGYVTGRLLEGLFLWSFKQEMFTWRRFDGYFRTVIARRNPNLLLLSVGVGFDQPKLGFFAVAAWTVVANVVPIIRIVQAFVERRRGVEIKSWYEDAMKISPPSEAVQNETRETA